MRLWLAISSVIFMLWAAVLLLSPQTLLAPEYASTHPGSVTLLALVHFVGAVLAAWTASNPRAHLLGIYSTMLLLLARWMADTYGVLVALPPEQAALTLADLISSLALLVGVLEALPRFVGAEAAGKDRSEIPAPSRGHS